ncbi:hypothetical protein UA08_08662 [Talaromyces atroroseus]|uniref:Lysine-specific metallo-endopeptidase domain-containing protein n=1 Tax=Talaromyces atroroseus TaxID=1441469 RepID=A0A225A629_TALAT|nr:hypothetical protein UA08_08662 [Talaromyces atroroseus]OKL55931.1 hypothetical protein UA08_08662 [Talaromyces atroroseus]
MRLSFSRFCVLALCGAASISRASLFTLVTEGGGQCDSSMQTTLDQWISDSKELVAAALWAVEQRSSNNEEILAFFTSYFGIKFDYENGGFANSASGIVFATVRNTLTLVSNFLNGQGIPEAMNPTTPPYLFCGDGAYSATGWYASVLGFDGKPVPNLDTGEGYYTVWDMYKQEVVTQAKNPFYSAVQNGYAFGLGKTPCATRVVDGEEVAPAAFVTRPYFPKSLPDEGFVIDWNPSMTLCDMMLEAPEAPYVALLKDIAYPTKDSPINLDSQVPLSTSFYHELTHLVSKAVEDNWYDLNAIIKNAVIDAAGDSQGAENNAESYMFFSLALWYYRNPNDGYRATFYRGKSNDPLRISTTS